MNILSEALKVSNVSNDQREEFISLFKRFQNQFALEETELHPIQCHEHIIDTGDAKPVKVRLRPVQVNMKQIVNNMIQKLLDAGFIKPSKSP